ncbi:MAG: hypothetical protein WAO98_02765 [Alphaproteobacteria bacterium]
MDTSSNQNQTVSMWITSLAISVTCCAILFVIFAGYLTDIKRNIDAGNQQIVQMAIYQQKLLTEIQNLQRTIATNQATPATTQAAPAPAVPAPVSAVPPAFAPSSSGPTSSAPPPGSPTAIPEVPAKP